MIDFEHLVENGDPAEVASLTKQLLDRMLEEIHSPSGIEEVWAKVQLESRFQEMQRYWPDWHKAYRQREWEVWCREIEKLAYGTRPYCLLCGECCRKGSPTLYTDDSVLLRQGIIKRSDLITLRFGEIGFSPAKNDLVLVSEEQVKIKEKPGSRECLFFDSAENKCQIYAYRPVQCRTMECWNPDLFQSLEALRFLSRNNLLNPDDPLLPVIETHGKRCDLSKLHEVLNRIRKGGAFAQQEILDMMLFDQHVRDFLEESQGIGVEHLSFLFGRSLKELLPIFGLQLEIGADGTFSLRPMLLKKTEAV